MDILLQPDELSMVGSMKHFIISANSDISFVLTHADTGHVIIEHTYTPGKSGKIEVNLENVIQPLLSFQLKDVAEPYRQTMIARKFTATLSPALTSGEARSVSFTVVRAGVDHLADSAQNFLKGNFMTWQPSVKPVTYYTPEFLTYFAQVNCVAKCKAYVDKEGTLVPQEIVLAEMSAGTVWTIPVQYAIIAGKAAGLPSYYDVFVEDSAGQRLTYVQRYFPSDLKSQHEQWVLFENSLGGIDTFRAYGDSENTAKHVHNVVEIENDAQEYRVDTEREFKKNTGHLNAYERKWLLDFFPSLGKFVYAETSIRRIVVTDSDVSYQDRELPSSYTFTYKYAEARPYLNLRRPEEPPADFLKIRIPDVGSFSLAPRLVELGRLPLSEGALFPVQGPYADKWTTTTAEAILDFIRKSIVAAYKGDGSFGHSHENMSVLTAIDRVGRYLTLNARKIFAEFADKAQIAENISKDSDDWEKILRKDIPDEARELIKFSKGLEVGKVGRGAIDKDGNAVFESVKSADFKESGTLLDGTGYGIYKDEHGRTHVVADILEARKKATFAELNVKELSFTTGDVGHTSAGCKIHLVKKLDNGDYRCFFLAEDDDRRISNDFHVGDQAMARTGNIISKTTQVAQNRYYWRLVVGVDDVPVELEDGKKYHYIDLSNTKGTVTLSIKGKEYQCVGYDTTVENDEPKADDKLVQLGSQTDVDRQYAYIIYVSTGQHVAYNGINDYDLGSHSFLNISKKGIELNADYLRMTHGGTGQPINVVNERGAWYEGAVSHHYDHWSHNNATWLCNIEKGKTTTSEPSEDNPEWIRETYGVKGDDGDSEVVLTILTDKGNIIRNGQGEVKLTAIVTQGGIDITDSFTAIDFSWQRNSGNPEYDTEWNNRHKGVGNTISVSAQDIFKRAVFDCILLDK